MSFSSHSGEQFEKNAQRATKICIPFDPALLLLGLYPQDIIKMGKSPTCTNIFIAALFVVAIKVEIEGMPINWGMTEQVVVYECNEILLCYKK